MIHVGMKERKAIKDATEVQTTGLGTLSDEFGFWFLGGAVIEL